MDPSSNVDDAILESVLHLSLEEATHRGERLHGKSRVGASLTTEQYALQLQQAEMEIALQSVRDARLARNLAHAADDDAQHLIHLDHEDREDRENRGDAMASLGGTSPFDVDLDSLSMIDSPASLISDLVPQEEDRDDGGHCVGCGSIGLEYMKVPCGHSYDLLCLAGLIQQAAIDEALYPPRCCKQVIPLENFRGSIPTEIWENFEKKSIEWTTPAKDRRYCPWPMCSAFLGSVQTLDRETACPACHGLLCTHCQQPAHPWSSSCSREDDSAMIDHLLEENRWQRCPGCSVIVELSFGCNHMTCRCGAEFCYECATVWKNCGCAVWNEQKLYAEAERRISAEEEEWKSNPQQAGASSLLRDLGNLRVYVPPLNRRRARIEALADYLRNNHPCDHNWQQNLGSGHCGECGRSVESSLKRCNRCYIAACSRCAFNRP